MWRVCNAMDACIKCSQCFLTWGFWIFQKLSLTEYSVEFLSNFRGQCLVSRNRIIVVYTSIGFHTIIIGVTRAEICLLVCLSESNRKQSLWYKFLNMVSQHWLSSLVRSILLWLSRELGSWQFSVVCKVCFHRNRRCSDFIANLFWHNFKQSIMTTKKLKLPHKELEEILDNPDNQGCADCGQKAPRWASVLFFCVSEFHHWWSDSLV